MKCNLYYLTFLIKAQIFIIFALHSLAVTTDNEEKFWRDVPRVCGIDEAGRGPLAGPVVAAAVVFPRNFRPGPELDGLNDSKQLSPARRQQLAQAVRSSALMVAVAEAGPEEIDRLNIFGATMLAMNRAVESLVPLPSLLLIDGNRFRPALPIPYITIVKGDASVFSIAAASILAKTHRDSIMSEAAGTYPEYGFEHHFGYPTRKHIEAIRTYGRTPIHRSSFRLRELGEK
ncbi:ribonuclease HII [Prosthecochloris sp. N3]|uniref:Ribonuclease HII n=1 Tax=Prosthecochloris ethylica TaxID=2743976 RepID=A0ABR9XRB9_9CHLB|nr:ribonuclease HII [Prosthecochloris ethylica]MBF0636591.1 ribonuclease HII [Prosthecochloris ethylica]NUK47223.1 ribonuclease HII [Prosthecochloris ethylica]RNA64029.1 ribonuclease HII [Prosthecochloris sp. ZM_2]